MIDLVVTAAAVGLWLLVYAFCRLLTRPAVPPAAPATMELGPESPALPRREPGQNLEQPGERGMPRPG
jgi:hypothetical protein